MATHMSTYPSFAARAAGIRVIVCEPDVALRSQLRSVIDSDPLLVLAAESRNWAECAAGLDEVVPELLIIRSELIPLDWSSRCHHDSFLPVVIALKSGFDTEDNQSCNVLPVPARPDAIRSSLNQAVNDIYDRKAKQLLYLVDRYVAASQEHPAHKSILKVERDGQLLDLPTEKIMSVIAARKCVSLHSTAGRFMLREPIHLVATKLDARFFVRIHRSIIINCRHLDRLASLASKLSVVVLSDGSRYSVGGSYRDALLQKIESA